MQAVCVYNAGETGGAIVIAFNEQDFSESIPRRPRVNIHPVKVMTSQGARCQGCDADIPKGTPMVWSVPWSVAGVCCCVECILRCITQGYKEAAEYLTKEGGV